MRKALALSLAALLLGGCASDPADRDISGTWINQAAIDAAAKGGPLREALQAYGPNLEWDVNTRAGQARYTNGFENDEGKLLGEEDGAWKVDFYGSSASELQRDGDKLNQTATENEPQQVFDGAQVQVPAGGPVGASFESGTYSAYMRGAGYNVDAPGQGARGQWQPEDRTHTDP